MCSCWQKPNIQVTFTFQGTEPNLLKNLWYILAFTIGVSRAVAKGEGGDAGGVTPPENQLSENEEFVSKRKIFDKWTIS
jgi:hypothetical protein